MMKKLSRTIFAAAIATGLLAPTGMAQTKTGASPQFKTPAGSSSDGGGGGGNAPYVVAPDEDYLIGPSDVVEIRVEDAPEMSGVFRLDSKGTVDLPVVGVVEARDKKSSDVARSISDRLRAAQYLVNPIVVVSVRQSNSRSYFIQGAVRRPGIYQIEGRPSILKLITIAGGLADNYGATAYLMRERRTSVAGAENSDPQTPAAATSGQSQPDKPAETAPAASDSAVKTENAREEYEVTKVNINYLLRGNLDQNVLVSPGDIVHIPAADGFFVAGEVKTPGYFMLKEGTTLRQAIALAQGINYQGKAERAVIFRESESGERTEIAVNLTAVMTGKAPDMPILPNDIVMVPNDQKKEVTKNLLKAFSNTLPGLLMRGLGVW